MTENQEPRRQERLDLSLFLNFLTPRPYTHFLSKL